MEDNRVDIDSVVFGTKGKFEDMYCRTLDGLVGFEDVEKEFERAIKEGAHKEYTQEEIKELLEEAFSNCR